VLFDKVIGRKCNFKTTQLEGKLSVEVTIEGESQKDQCCLGVPEMFFHKSLRKDHRDIFVREDSTLLA
jgi:hypothetical protein